MIPNKYFDESNLSLGMGGGKDADYTNCSDMVSTKYFNKSKRIFIM